jgi:pyruvate/oxaloacetate carboxyltransferase
MGFRPELDDLIHTFVDRPVHTGLSTVRAVATLEDVHPKA